jgi:hypothetical protein
MPRRKRVGAFFFVEQLRCQLKAHLKPTYVKEAIAEQVRAALYFTSS